MDAVDVAGVEADGVGRLGGHVLELEEVVGELGRAGHFGGALQAEHEQVQHEALFVGKANREY